MEKPGAKNILVAAINDRSARPVVIGLGHVGLVEAVNYAEAGFQVTGYDINKNRVRALNEGRSQLHDIESSRLAKLIASGKLTVCDDPACLKDRDIYVITVPTLLTEEKDPYVGAVEHVSAAIKEALSRPALVILTSTCYPGATRDLILNPFVKEGFALDEDFWLGYAPARIDPGNEEWPMARIPKVVSGISKDSLELAKSFFEQTIDQVVPADSCEAAEMTKLLENSFRLVNMGFINEMGHVCRELDLDIWEVIRLASTKPFGFMPFYPGPGPGGTCVPVDPFYIAWKAKTEKCRANFIELAGELFDETPHELLERIYDLLNETQTPLAQARVLLLGVAYKKDVGEIAGSSAQPLIRLLSERGARVDYHDPFVSSLQTADGTMSSVKMSAELLREQDVVVLLTAHSDINYRSVVENAPLVFDTRNRLAEMSGDNIHRL